MKKLILLTLLAFGLFAPKSVMAQYGQYGQILGSSASDVAVIHEVVPAGIEDYLNPKTLSVISFALSGVMFAVSNKRNKIKDKTS